MVIDVRLRRSFYFMTFSIFFMVCICLWRYCLVWRVRVLSQSICVFDFIYHKGLLCVYLVAILRTPVWRDEQELHINIFFRRVSIMSRSINCQGQFTKPTDFFYLVTKWRVKKAAATVIVAENKKPRELRKRRFWIHPSLRNKVRYGTSDLICVQAWLWFPELLRTKNSNFEIIVNLMDEK